MLDYCSTPLKSDLKLQVLSVPQEGSICTLFQPRCPFAVLHNMYQNSDVVAVLNLSLKLKSWIDIGRGRE